MNPRPRAAAWRSLDCRLYRVKADRARCMARVREPRRSDIESAEWNCKRYTPCKSATAALPEDGAPAQVALKAYPWLDKCIAPAGSVDLRGHLPGPEFTTCEGGWMMNHPFHGAEIMPEYGEEEGIDDLEELEDFELEDFEVGDDDDDEDEEE